MCNFVWSRIKFSLYSEKHHGFLRDKATIKLQNANNKVPVNNNMYMYYTHKSMFHNMYHRASTCS